MVGPAAKREAVAHLQAVMGLSERRAQAVAEALTAAGWPAPAFEVEAVGDEGAVTDAGVREPMRQAACTTMAVTAGLMP